VKTSAIDVKTSAIDVNTSHTAEESVHRPSWPNRLIIVIIIIIIIIIIITSERRDLGHNGCPSDNKTVRNK
jgi:hypothetical protein